MSSNTCLICSSLLVITSSNVAPVSGCSLFLLFAAGRGVKLEKPKAPTMAALVSWCEYLKEFAGPPQRSDLLSSLPSKFLQSMHLQFSEQRTLAWKHSQYFLRHPDFLQLHPLLCLPRIVTAPATTWTALRS